MLCRAVLCCVKLFVFRFAVWGWVVLCFGTVPSVETVKNVGVSMDSNLSFDTHLNNFCKILYIQIRKLYLISPYISSTAANKLAAAFILSRLDYCNSLLAGLPDSKLAKLQ